MMNQQYSLPGRGRRCGGGCDRSPYRAANGGIGRGMASPGCGMTRGGCGVGGRLPTNRDMNPGCKRTPCACGTQNGNGNSCTGGTPSGGGILCGCTSRSSVPSSATPAREMTPCTACRKQGSTPTPAVRKLMEQIRAVDFALYETILYLDVYPNSCAALETYHKLKAQHEELTAAYEATVGPLTAFGNQSTTSWDWMKKPFPWEYDAE